MKYLKRTIDEWKALTQTSYHVRPGETVSFQQNREGDMIRANIILGAGRSVFLGAYFLKDLRNPNVEAGSCWYHGDDV